MSFGFSVGDIVTGVVLIKNVIDALHESTGSKAEFKALLGTLKSLENAFRICVLVYQQCDELHVEHQVQMDAKEIHQQLLNENEQCKKKLEDFLVSLSPYTTAFADEQSRTIAISSHVRKITWLSHKSSIRKLERDLKWHLNSLQLCAMAFCHFYLTANTKKASSTESKVDAILSNVTDLRAEVTTIFASVQTRNSRSPSSIGHMWEGMSAQLDIVILHDAINRTIPLPMMLLCSRMELHKIVLWMYHDRDMPGRAKVQRKEYTITDEDANGALIEESNWNTIYHPGKHLSLNMIFPASNAWNPSFCPRCSRPAMGKILPGEQRRCVMCQLTFRIFDKERIVEEIPSQEPEGNSGVVSANGVDASWPVQQKIYNNAQGDFEDKRNPKNNKDELFYFKRIHYHRDIEIKKNSASSDIPTEKLHHKFEPDKLPPIHRAAACGDLKQITDLIDEGIDVDLRIPFSMRNEEEWEFCGATPLLLAAWFGKLKAVEKLVQKGANVNALDCDHTGILFYAISGPCRGRLVMPLLSVYGADPNIEDCWGRLPLLVAAAEGLHLLLHPLVEYGNDLDHQDHTGDSSLHFAVRHSHEEAVLVLLELGADATIYENTKNRNPLHDASYGGAEAVVGLLLQEMQHLNAKDKDGHAAIHLAAQMDHVTIIKLLLENSSNIECQNVDGETPLLLAATYGCERSTKLLLSAGAQVNTHNTGGLTPLHIASANGHVSVVKQLLVAGARNLKDTNGMLPLHYAAINSGTELIVELLIQYDPGMIDTGDKTQWTALHWAANEGHLQLVRLLLERGSDVTTKSDGGSLPLHHAAMYGRELVVQLLLERNPNTVNIGEDDGTTALHWAVYEGHLSTVKVLLMNGSDLDIRDRDNGWTVLFTAVLQGRKEITELLLQHGSNLKTGLRDNEGASPWDTVNSSLPALDMIHLLVSYGWSVNEQYYRGRTALHVAVLDGNEETARYLISHGCNIQIGDIDGDTPLDTAVLKGNRSMETLIRDSLKLPSSVSSDSGVLET